VYRPCYKKANI